jgi:hypothetical protein
MLYPTLIGPAPLAHSAFPIRPDVLLIHSPDAGIHPPLGAEPVAFG